jgi:hypothetical protein
VPSQQLQGQFEKLRSVDTGNHITGQEKHQDNSHKASFGNSALENNY